MALRFEPMTQAEALAGRAVFLSASIPDPERWTGEFDPREITDAVVAAARAVLTAGGTLVTAAHPTIAPLMLYVAGEFPQRFDGRARVITYQSDLFQGLMPEATLRFQASGVGDFRLTPAVPGEEPTPAQWSGSLLRMREQMFDETEPVAALFIGGMNGIREEYDLLASRRPAPVPYPVGRPGGEAAQLVRQIDSDLVSLLATGDVYPSVFRAVLEDLLRRLG
jgi:hypothetical protein